MRMLGALAASVFAGALGTAAVQAQTAAPTAAAPSAAEKSAMERAQREADGPRRRILEAAKVKAVVKPDLPAPLLPAPATAAGAAPMATPAPAPAPAERPPVLATLQAAVDPVELPASGVAAVPTVARVEAAQPSVALIALPAARVITLPPPRLLSKVDPELPARVQRRGARRTELMVDLTIAADGGVRDVRLRGSTDDEVLSAVRDALLQWRYEPQPVERPHTVQLVFDAN